MNESRQSRARTVLQKELRETLRDRRVLLAVVVSPLLVTPLLLAVMGFFMGQKSVRDQSEVLEVAVVEGSVIPGLRHQIESDPTLTLSVLETAEHADAAIRERTIRAALIIPESAADDIAAARTTRILASFDVSNEKSTTAHRRLRNAVRTLRAEVVQDRLKERNLDPAILEPIEIEDRNLATEAETGGLILGIILPYVVILTSSFGAMTSAFDLIAGEKEKGTLETLLVSPASRREIIIGKLAACCTVSALAGFCSIAGLVATLEIGLRVAADLLPIGIAVSYVSIAAMLLAIIPLTLTTSALLLVISAFARNPKEAQAYAFPFMIVVILPAMLSFILPVESGWPISLVPILNTALVMKQVLSGVIRPDFIALATVSSLLYAGMALRLVVALFQKESILFRI